jgi:hypothetical protein
MLTEEDEVKKGSRMDEAVPADPLPKGAAAVFKGTVFPSTVSFQMKLPWTVEDNPG